MAAAAAAGPGGNGSCSGEVLRLKLDYGGNGDGGAAARFKGYKLDAAHHPQVSVLDLGGHGDSDTRVREGRPDDEDSHFALEYVRQFRMHNHLFVNPHSASPNAYYLSAGGTVVAVTPDQSSNSPVLTHVARLPQPDTTPATNSNEGEAFPPSMTFPAHDVAVVSDGAGALHVYELGGDATKWKLSGSANGVLGGDKRQGFVVRAAAMAPGSDRLLCIVQRVDEADDQRDGGGISGLEQQPKVKSVVARCNVTLMAAVFTRDASSAGSSMPWRLHACTPFRMLRHTPAFLAAEASGDAFCIAALGGADLAEGLDTSSVEGKEEPHRGAHMHGGPTQAAARYSWSQDGTEVVLHKNINREDVQDTLVAFSPEHLRIEVIGKGEVGAPMAKKQLVEGAGDTPTSAGTEPLIWQLAGKLYGAIVPGFSTWAWTEDVLEVRMRKMDGSVRWPTVFEGDAAGLNVDETLSEDHVAAARAALSRFTHEGDLSAESPLRAGTAGGPRAGIGARDTPNARTPETAEADMSIPVSVATLDKGKIPDLFGEGADDEDEDGHVLESGDVDAGPHQLYVSKLDSEGRPAEVPTTVDVNGRRLMCEAHFDGRPAMVLADDIHGCVCALSLLPTPPSVSHCATFPALQYVVSSKRERRHVGMFLPAASRAFVCEVARTVYIYDRPEESTEQAPSHVAMLEPVADDDAVLGAAAPDSNTLIVLTRRRIYCMRFITQS